jgi:hypothetical protein
MRLVLGRNLLPSEHLAGMTTRSVQTDDIIVSKFGNGAFNYRRAFHPLADFPRNVGCDPRIRRLFHQAERLLNALVRNEAQKGGLFKLHRQSLAQRVVENRFARSVPHGP